MNDSEKAIEAVKKRFNILPPVTKEEAIAKRDEIEKRAIRNMPAKTKEQCEGLNQEEIMERFYSRGNKRD